MGKAALIIGGSGGIGAALTTLWTQQQRFDNVFVSSHQSLPNCDIPTEQRLSLDLADEDSIARAAKNLQHKLNGDTLSSIVICTGFLHDKLTSPERRIAALKRPAFDKAMTINALGPLLVAKHFSLLLPKDKPSQLVALSARVGSISDNQLGGWFSYRCSKAALNQGFKTLAVDLGRTHPHCVVTLYHPGTVDTPLSQPFQRNVPPEQLFDPERAARQLDRVMQQRVTPGDSLFVDWAGKVIDY